MSKDYKGYELIKAIRDGEIKENSVIEVHSLSVGDNVIAEIKYINRRLIWDSGKFNTGFLCDDSYYFRIVEEQEEIDIQDIEPLNAYKLIEAPYMKECLDKNNYTKFCELLKQSELELVDNIKKLGEAVKQLDQQINDK